MENLVKKALKKVIGKDRIELYRSRAEVKKELRNHKKKYISGQLAIAVTEQSPLVSVIILNRDGADKLKILMQSFQACQFYNKYEIVLVDNASKDNSVSYMESLKEHMSITILQNTDNRSFSECNNQGARAAKGDYLLFLNNDTEVTDGWLDALLKVALEKQNVGAVGARLIYPRIPKHEKNATKSYHIQHAGIGFRDKKRDKMYFVQPYNLENGKRIGQSDSACKECACVTAAVLLMKKSVFEEVGGYDERYIYGYEDADICLKAEHAGYHNYYVPECMVFHYEFGTQNADDSNQVKERRRHNMEVFKGKWQAYLEWKVCQDKIQNSYIFTKQKLQIGILLPTEDEAVRDKSVLLAEAISNAMKKKNYVVRLYSYDIKICKYPVELETDVIITFDSKISLSQMADPKNNLIQILWKWGESFETNLDNIMKQITDAGKQTFLDDKRIDICGAMPNNDTRKFWGDYHYANALQKEFEKKGYHVKVLSKEYWYDRSDAKYVIILRGVKEYFPSKVNGKKYIMWNISHPADVSIEEYNMFDYVFFASDIMKNLRGNQIVPSSGVLLQCTDPEVMHSDDVVKKSYELLFVGNSRRVYRRILKDLLPTEYKLTVYGRHWDDFPVQQYVEADYIANEEVGQAYHDAKILLNDHWDDMLEYGIISNRIFDALAVGAFVISDEVPGMKEILGDSVVTYSDREDLKNKIDYYLLHEEERKQKTLLGQRIVLEKHTFANRVEEIIKVMQSL